MRAANESFLISHQFILPSLRGRVARRGSWRKLELEVPGYKRTGRIIAAADLNELLDVGDFARHGGQR